MTQDYPQTSAWLKLHGCTLEVKRGAGGDMLRSHNIVAFVAMQPNGLPRGSVTVTAEVEAMMPDRVDEMVVTLFREQLPDEPAELPSPDVVAARLLLANFGEDA